jgi:hypothetical protein
MTEAPTPGRYLLYLDFKVGGEVRTAEFVLDTGAAPAADEPTEEPAGEPTAEPAAGHGGSGHDH